MRRYGIRALGLLLAVLLAAAAILRLSDRPGETVQASAILPEEEVQEELPETGVLVRSQVPRETVSLYSEAWKQLERLRLDSAGKGVLEEAEAGVYHLIRGDGKTLTFSVDAAGVVEVSGGNGWGNGRILELSDDLRGSVQIQYYTEQQQTVTVRLEGAGGVQSRDLEAAAQENGEFLAECRFSGLQPGQYQVYVGGDFVVTVSVTESDPDRTLSLY